MQEILVLDVVVWSVLLPLLGWATIRLARREPGPKDEALWPLLALAAGLLLRFAVSSMPSDVRPDYALGERAWTIFYRASAIKLALWQALAWLPKLHLGAPWDAFIMLDRLAGGLSAFFVYRYARRVHNDAAAAFAAALIVACCPAAVRFSATETPCVLAMLFTALALDCLSLAARSDDPLPLWAGAGWLAALVEVRPDGGLYALAVVLFLAPEASRLVRGRGKVLAAAGALAALAVAPRLIVNFQAYSGSDIVKPMLTQAALRDVWRLPFSSFTGRFWGMVGAAGLVLHLFREPRIAVWRFAGLLAGTVLLAHGFGLMPDHATNIRYYLPALVLAAVPAARGLSVLACFVPGESGRRLCLAALVIAAPLSSWGLLRARWAAGEEFNFAAREISRLPDGCTIVTRSPGELGALELSQELSASLGRRHEWVQLAGDAGFQPAAEPACTVYYRGGRCAIGRWALGRDEAPDDCGLLEKGWRLTPLAETLISGGSLVSETYRSMPYQAGFYKLSAR